MKITKELTNAVCIYAVERGNYLRNYLLEKCPDEIQRKLAFSLVYCLRDLFNKTQPKIEYTRFVGRLADGSKTDYHLLDNLIKDGVEQFFKGFGTEYKGTYNFVSTIGWVMSHTSIGYGDLPKQFGTERMSSDEPIEKLGKFLYFMVNFKW